MWKGGGLLGGARWGSLAGGGEAGEVRQRVGVGLELAEDGAVAVAAEAAGYVGSADLHHRRAMTMSGWDWRRFGSWVLGLCMVPLSGQAASMHSHLSCFCVSFSP